jgi:hypothetical protein
LRQFDSEVAQTHAHSWCGGLRFGIRWVVSSSFVRPSYLTRLSRDASDTEMINGLARKSSSKFERQDQHVGVFF